MFKFTLFLMVSYVLFDSLMSISVPDFFPQIKNNLTAVTWAHAVNNASYLNSTLINNKVMMLEADVQLGSVIGGNETIPIMAHPPSVTSDLSLINFLNNVSSHNENVQASSGLTKKGVKLDFKSIESFNDSSLIIIQGYRGNYPLWLNADILEGPGNPTSTPVNASEFFHIAKNLNIPNATLSLGWTTSVNNLTNTTGYTNPNVNEMVELIQRENLTSSNYSLTFAVRARLAAESPIEMNYMLSKVPHSTLTVWSAETDKVNVTNLRNLIKNVGVTRVFLDVPESLSDQLRLDQISSGGGNGTGNGTGSGTGNGTSGGSTPGSGGGNSTGNGVKFVAAGWVLMFGLIFSIMF